MFDTIVATATSNGIGAISIVRLSGPKSLDLALKITNNHLLKARYSTLSFIYDIDGSLIDRALVIYFKGPNSFTGEDVVEFQCHGGIGVSSILINTLLKLGARPANPGEFSKRAVINERMDLTEAEAVAKIIEAKSAHSIKILAQHMKGELKNYIENIRNNLVEILAYIEVGIDYAEDDLPQDLEISIKNKLVNLHNDLLKTYNLSKQNEGLINGFKIAIIGKPNVGKSSLLNCLLNYERAIVSDIAGTTRDTVEEEIKIGTHLVRLIDTAGIRNAKEKIEEIGIQRTKKSIEEAEIIIALFDSSNHIEKEDEEILELLINQEDKKIFLVLNKSDLPEVFPSARLKEPIKISCKESTNEIIDSLDEYLNSKSMDEGLILSTARQINCVKDSLESIKEGINLLENGEIELFAFEINQAISNISSITRPFCRDEILDQMFSTFCLGK